MPGRKVPLVTGEFYHIFNRGNDKKEIFNFPNDFNRFIKTIYYYHFSGKKIKFSLFTKSKFNFLTPITEEKLVEIYAYCLMPNHFHLLLKQLQDGGIPKFLSQISNSYTKYFNVKYNHIGSLFQGTYKAVHIDTNEQFLHVSRYIHLNPLVAELVTDLAKYPWSSYLEYKYGEIFCNTREILGFFKNRKKYLEFIQDQADYAKRLHFIKKHLLD